VRNSTRVWRFDLCHHAKQSGFAATVSSHYTNALTRRDAELDGIKYRAFAVILGDFLDIK